MLGDFDGPHTRRWLRVFVERGHELHAISFYRPREEIPGVQLHVLKEGAPPSEASTTSHPAAAMLWRAVPLSLRRVFHAGRYVGAGLADVLLSIRPDVFHAHYAVEHGFYGAFVNFHPFVVSGWGSDVLVESRKLLGRFVAGFTVRRADLVTANDPAMARRILQLGVAPEKVRLVRLGIDAPFFDPIERSVNVSPTGGPPTVISDRALEPNYNIDVVLRAFSKVHQRLPAARLIIAGRGSREQRLKALTSRLGLEAAVRFVGQLTPEALQAALQAAQVYVSVPSSDSFALSNLEAMASGCFPVISDLSSAEGMLIDRQTGLLLPARSVRALTEAMLLALQDADLRRRAAFANRKVAEEAGNLERNMLVMEREYYRLAGRPLAGDAI